MSNQDTKTVEPVPAWVQGVWRRNSMREESGLIDDTTQVFWVQTPALFATIVVGLIKAL